MTKPIRLIELFAGYGSQALALKRLNIPFEHYRVVEFDKYAVKSYNAIHGTDFKPTDIRDVTGASLGIEETDKYDYLLTYSFPCTDLSNAGKMLGMSKGSETRSGLLWEVERILREINEAQELSLPQFLVMENVPMVHADKNIKDFALWISFLDSLGYTSKWQDLNAKDYGIPQNRERCFLVSYLDKSLKYAFPLPVKLEKTAQDYLEDDVDEKYFIKTDKAKELIEKLIIENDLDGVIYVKDNTEKGYKELDTGGIVNLYYPESLTKRGRVQTRGRVCPTVTVDGILTQMEKKRRTVDLSTVNPHLKDDCVNGIGTRQRGIGNVTAKDTGVLEATKKRAFLNKKRIDSVDEDIAKALTARDFKGFSTGEDSATQNGVINTCIKVGEMDLKHELASRVYSAEGISPAITCNQAYQPNFIIEYRIRKLTPLECFRLMDVSDEDAKKMLAVNSETQCYKQAGNSIVVAVLEKIFFNIFCGGSDTVSRQVDIFDIL